MVSFLKSNNFQIAGSFIIGLGIMSIFIPRCPGGTCMKAKAGNAEEINKSVYQIGSKCYQFKTETMSCPQSVDIIESFRK